VYMQYKMLAVGGEKVLSPQEKQRLIGFKPVYQVTSGLDIEMFMGKFVDAAKAAEILAGKPSHLMFGTTGAGKTTTVNAALGAKMAVDEDPNTGKVRVTSDGPGVIGHKAIAETLYPTGYLLSSGSYLVDCAGLFDNRGILYETLANAGTLAVTKSAQSANVVVVIPFGALQIDRGNPLRNIAGMLVNFLKGDIKESKNSLLFLITQPPSDRTKVIHFLNQLKEIYLQVNPPTSLLDRVKKTDSSLPDPGDDAFLQLMYVMLSNPANVLLIHPEDLVGKTEFSTSSSGKPLSFRQTLLGKLQQLAPLSPSKFTFVASEEAMHALKDAMFATAEYGNHLISGMLGARQKIADLNEKLEALRKEEKNQTAVLTEAGSKNSGVAAQAIETAQRALEDLEDAAELIDRKIGNLKEEIEEIKAIKNKEDSDKAVLYWKRSVQEANTLGGKTQVTFSYSGIKFLNVVHHNIGGKDDGWTDETSEPDSGRYAVTYFTRRGKDANGSVELYVEHRERPEVKAYLSKLTADLASKKEKLEQLEADKRENGKNQRHYKSEVSKWERARAGDRDALAIATKSCQDKLQDIKTAKDKHNQEKVVWEQTEAAHWDALLEGRRKFHALTHMSQYVSFETPILNDFCKAFGQLEQSGELPPAKDVAEPVVKASDTPPIERLASPSLPHKDIPVNENPPILPQQPGWASPPFPGGQMPFQYQGFPPFGGAFPQWPAQGAMPPQAQFGFQQWGAPSQPMGAFPQWMPQQQPPFQPQWGPQGWMSPPSMMMAPPQGGPQAPATQPPNPPQP
jgi:hypothetical protein